MSVLPCTIYVPFEFGCCKRRPYASLQQCGGFFLRLNRMKTWCAFKIQPSRIPQAEIAPTLKKMARIFWDVPSLSQNSGFAASRDWACHPETNVFAARDPSTNVHRQAYFGRCAFHAVLSMRRDIGRILLVSRRAGPMDSNRPHSPATSPAFQHQ